jgi:flagellar hook protein FlgE
MFTAISGMRNHQTMLDVISNNIANVNTVGYKAGRVMFRDLLSQTISGGSAASSFNNTGGVNPIQMGMGMSVASIDTIQTQGVMQATGNVTDLAMNGDGYFITQAGGQTLYTRAGNFNFDSAGQLVDAGGGVVQGWTAQRDPNSRAFVGFDPTGQVQYGSPNGLAPLTLDPSDPSKIGSIAIGAGMTIQPQETKNVTLVGNLDAGATAANLVNSAGLAGTTQLKVWDGGNPFGPPNDVPVMHTYTVGTATMDFPIVDSLGNAHSMSMTLMNLSGTQIPGAQGPDAAGNGAQVYGNNTWAWTVNLDPNDTSAHLLLDNSTFYDPSTYDPMNPITTTNSLVRISSSGLVSFNPNGSLNWVTYQDRNAEHFGTNVYDPLNPVPNDSTIPGGAQPFPLPGSWQNIADTDGWDGSTIGFEGAVVPSNNGAPATQWNNPDMGGIVLDLKKCSVGLVFQNVPDQALSTGVVAGPSGISAGQRVFTDGGAGLPPVAGITLTGESNPNIEDWYTQWFDIDWGTVSTITAADFDRSTSVVFNPAAPNFDTMTPGGDTNRDGIQAGDNIEGHDFAWDPYVQSDLNGGRDGMTQDATGSWQLIGGVMAYVPQSDARIDSQDGYQRGVLQSLQIDSRGVIVGGFTNGISQDLAQIAVANFQNPSGMIKQGATHFAPSVNSGNPVVGTAQTGGRGTIVSGVLEQSNVDLTSELTNMIVAQRGFEVNARVITTSDTILNTLINLGR